MPVATFYLKKTSPRPYLYFMKKVTQPFLFIKYSKTTYQKHHLHVNIQNLGHIFNRKKNYGSLNRGTLIRFS
jgi:hypothetical protein